MRRLFFISFIILLLCSFSFPQEKEGFEGRPITENIWMQTGHTLNEGEFNVGLGPLAVGITNQVQVETNILYYIAQVFNGKIKVNIIKQEDMSFSAGLDYRSYDLEKSATGSDVGVSEFSPYLTLSNKINPKNTIHLSGKYSLFSVDIDEFENAGLASGAEIMVGLDYSLSHKTKLLAESGYDFTFNGPRIGGGVLFGWESFRLKLGVSYFNPENTEGFTFPVIGLWWRFNG